MAHEVLQGFGMYKRRYEQRPDRCPNCERDTSLARRDSRLVWPDISENLVLPMGACVMEDVWSCTYCDQTLIELRLYEVDHDAGSDVAPSGVRLVWPPRPPRELPVEAPEEVRSLYREASMAESVGALRGAGALFRAAVERLCDAQGAVGATLYDQIEDLAKRGVQREVVDDLHEARLLGNWTLHEGIQFSADEVADVAELIAEAAHVLYVEPAQRVAMRDARKARRDGTRGAL
ncbi:MAG: DUF4145 domain-containing protein [Acidimicrobiales bacterium]